MRILWCEGMNHLKTRSDWARHIAPKCGAFLPSDRHCSSPKQHRFAFLHTWTVYFLLKLNMCAILPNDLSMIATVGT